MPRLRFQKFKGWQFFQATLFIVSFALLIILTGGQKATSTNQAQFKVNPSSPIAIAEKPHSANLVVLNSNTEDPKKVKFNFFINTISDIDNRSGTFNADFYVNLAWYEPLLKEQPLSDIDQATLWTPELEAINSNNLKRTFEAFKEVSYPDANIQYETRFVGTFSTKFDLRKFPFDQQVFPLVFESSEFPGDQVILSYWKLDQPLDVLQKPYESNLIYQDNISPDMKLEEWNTEGLKVAHKINTYAYDQSSWSQLRVELKMNRLYGFYIFKVIIIIVFLVFLSWSTILIVNLQEIRYRLSLFFTLFLATVAFNFTMLQILPRISYLTVLDIYIATGYISIVLMALESVVASILLEQKSIALATKIDRVTMIVVPLLFLLVNFLLIAYVLI